MATVTHDQAHARLACQDDSHWLTSSGGAARCCRPNSGQPTGRSPTPRRRDLPSEITAQGWRLRHRVSDAEAPLTAIFARRQDGWRVEDGRWFGRAPSVAWREYRRASGAGTAGPGGCRDGVTTPRKRRAASLTAASAPCSPACAPRPACCRCDFKNRANEPRRVPALPRHSGYSHNQPTAGNSNRVPSRFSKSSSEGIISGEPCKWPGS